MEYSGPMQKSNLPFLIGAAVCLIGVAAFVAWPTFAENQRRANVTAEENNKDVKEEETEKPKTDANGIPEKPEAILGFIRKQARRLQFDPTIDEKGFKKRLMLMLKAADKILGQKTDEDLRLEAIQVKVAVLKTLKSNGDKSAERVLAKFLVTLKSDNNKGVQELAATQLHLLRAGNDVTKDNKTREALVKDTIAFVKAGKLDDRLEVIGRVARMFESAGHRETAARLMTEMASMMRASNDESLIEQAPIIEGMARQMVLVGNSMKLKGKTLKGKTLDIKDLKGKVILVDFWATWCAPCRAAIPGLKRLYKEYNDKGFEIIGISADSSRERLEAFVKDIGMPWPTLYEDGADGQHPVAMYYGVMKFPTTILIDRNGKVVEMDVHGARLERLIKGLLDDKKTGENGGKKEAPQTPKSK